MIHFIVVVGYLKISASFAVSRSVNDGYGIFEKSP